MQRYLIERIAIGMGLIGTHLLMFATGLWIGQQSVPRIEPWVSPSPGWQSFDRRDLPYEMQVGGPINSDHGLTGPEPSLLFERPEKTISSRVDDQ